MIRCRKRSQLDFLRIGYNSRSRLFPRLGMFHVSVGIHQYVKRTYISNNGSILFTAIKTRGTAIAVGPTHRGLIAPKMNSPLLNHISHMHNNTALSQTQLSKIRRYASIEGALNLPNNNYRYNIA